MLAHSCFTRDLNNWKLIKLRRPGATIDGEKKVVNDVQWVVEMEGRSDKHESVSNQMARFACEKEAAETGSDWGMIRGASRVEDKDDVDGVINMNDNARPSSLIEYADVAPSYPTVNEVDTTVDGVDASKFEPLWVPLDPANSKLIWVRRLMKSEERGADQRSPRQHLAKQWVPLDPSNSRLLWIRRSPIGSSRAKTTSNARKWVPLISDGSHSTQRRHQLVPNKSVATPIVNTLTINIVTKLNNYPEIL